MLISVDDCIESKAGLYRWKRDFKLGMRIVFCGKTRHRVFIETEMSSESTAVASAPPHFSLRFDAWGQLVLRDSSGQEHSPVNPVRAFPLSDPTHWVSVVDARGTELVCVPDIEQLPATTRDVLLEALSKNDFIPVIEHIEDATHGEPTQWHVRTDRGSRTFVLKGEDDIRTLPDGRLIITDSDGVRYLILSTRALDGHSRRILERFT